MSFWMRSVQFSRAVVPDSLRPHEPQNARSPCPPPTPKVHPNHVHCVSDAIQPSHPLSSPSPALNLSQHQGLFQWVSSSHHVAKVLEFQLQHQSFQWAPRTHLLKDALTWFIYRIVSFFKMEFCFNTRTASSLSFLIASSVTVWPQSLLWQLCEVVTHWVLASAAPHSSCFLTWGFPEAVVSRGQVTILPHAHTGSGTELKPLGAMMGVGG